ncbi:MAG: YgfZ/GcvT domain-containing protein [Gammaproteobacteria bacterium]
MSKPTLCELSNLGLIQASGEDALNFLHGQFTNDLNAVTESISQLSSYCNPKGRMLSIFRIFMRNNDYFLLMPRDVIEATLKKLTMFKLMAKVELSDVSDEFIIYGLAGLESDYCLKENNIPIPNTVDQSIQHNETTIIRIPSEDSRLLFISDPKDTSAIKKSISAKSTQTSSDEWELQDIRSGIPQITAETSEVFIPQMVNLELIGGVNFQKGCYPGQEIVARTHYLGKPNRRMFRINIETDNCPKPGTNIFSIKDGEQPVGKIVVAQNNMEETCEALAVLRTAKEDADDLHLESLSGPNITICNLPYSLEYDVSE